MSASAAKPDRLLLFAGGLATFTAIVHIFMGTPEVYQPLLSSSLPQPISLLLLACWHLVSVVLVASGAALLWGALPNNRSHASILALFVSVTWLVFGLVFIAIAVTFQGLSGLAVLPQWTLLLPVGVLAGAAGLRSNGTISREA
ncbi:hypothetical protein [Massilia sp. BJB1822]|uniref:hypothetical protein n=1 Tax=Massilia sp. BJB1822 TaxID=2744470 RepID=UPI00159328CD|nr:hypothetical protein [Massilia sp. BJB1822]NVD97667.1 hypothetical protein [Massilia sp. BJB1822]